MDTIRLELYIVLRNHLIIRASLEAMERFKIFRHASIEMVKLAFHAIVNYG